MSVILSLETSSTSCSVAIHDAGKLLASAEIHREQTHGAKLALLISQVVENASITFADLSCVAVTSGPGSYTGLRIGTATAKGLCYSTDIPLVAIDSLSVMTVGARRRFHEQNHFCPMLDARRMEVYCAVLNASMQFVEPIQAKVIEESSFKELLDEEPVLFFGNGADKIRSVISHPNARFAEDIKPLASDLGELAFARFSARQFEDVVHFEPLYLKEFLIKKSTKLDSLLNNQTG